jgi:hypothetical protein
MRNRFDPPSPAERGASVVEITPAAIGIPQRPLLSLGPRRAFK